MEKMKPILFNTEMVRALLDGRKTQTRRVVKPQPPEWWNPECGFLIAARAPCNINDTLYVRETSFKHPKLGYVYKADHEDWFTGTLVNNCPIKWRPSIHMPKEAARIFLRVTGLRVERLKEITAKDVAAEGIRHSIYNHLHNDWKTMDRENFATLWDTTIKPADRERYGWEANPWVFVIAFERCEKPEEGN